MGRRTRSAAAALAVAVLLAACSGGDRGPVSETPSDAAPLDAAPSDAEPAADAAPSDAEPAADGEPADAEPAADAAPSDAEPAADAAPADAEPAADAAPSDAEPAADAAPADAEPAADAAPADAEPAADAAPSDAEPAADAAPSDAEPAADGDPADVAPALVVTPATTGAELEDQLSAEEAACIRDSLGDAGLEGFRGATIVETAADSAGATFVFFCMTLQNAQTYGLAVLDAQAGGRSGATRGCLADLAQQQPQLLPLHLRLEMGQFDASDAQRFHDMTLAMYACFNDAEKVEYVLRLWEQVAGYAPLSGQSFVAVLAADEVSCLRDALPQGGFDALAATTSMVAGDGVPPDAAHCLGAGTGERIFLQVTRERAGGLQGDTQACLERYAGEHPDYVRLIAAAETGLVPVAALGAGADQAQVIELARDGWRLFDCLNAEELLRYQLLTAAALAPRR